jgi:hypothetical protein
LIDRAGFLSWHKALPPTVSYRARPQTWGFVALKLGQCRFSQIVALFASD